MVHQLERKDFQSLMMTQVTEKLLGVNENTRGRRRPLQLQKVAQVIKKEGIWSKGHRLGWRVFSRR